MNSPADKVLTYAIHDVTPYINWIYFFHAWGFQPRFATIADIHGCDACRASWLTTFSEEDRAKAAEAMQLLKEAIRMLNQLDETYHVHTIFRLCKANADGDNLLLDGTRFPLLRQQIPHPDGSPFLCLSDFVRPLASGTPDTVGIFAASCDGEVEYVRKVAWGYAKDENLSIPELLKEKFQGIRPAVGYPSLPDQSVNFLLNELLHMEQIGITLTENGAMRPHATVCGLMLAHPAARYFAVGKIGNDQLEDYARRRRMPINEVRKFLAANL